MISKTSLRFICLLDTYNRAKIPLTYELIARVLEESPYSSMSGLPILTFKYSRNKTTYTKSPLCPKVASIYVIVLQNFFRN
jgi:hypothetical protein